MSPSKSSLEQRLPGGMSLDEVITRMTEIARDRDDRDHFRALRAIHSIQSGGPALTAPLEPYEIKKRLGRLYRAVGKELAAEAFFDTFGGLPSPLVTGEERRRRGAIPMPPEVVVSEMKIDEGELPTTLRKFYKCFPDMRGLVPPGFPRTETQAIRASWIKDYSRRLIAAREAERRQQAYDAAQAAILNDAEPAVADAHDADDAAADDDAHAPA